jgi:trimeric autotransporter adhesin
MAQQSGNETKDAGAPPQLVLRALDRSAQDGDVAEVRKPALAAAPSAPSRPRVIALLLAFLAVAALGLGLGLGLGISKTTDNTDTAAGPLLASVLSVVFDAGNTVLTDTNVTDVRCALANATGASASRVLLVSWTDASNTTYVVAATDPLNQGSCAAGPVRRRLASSASSSSGARLLPSTFSPAVLTRFTILVNDESIPLATRQIWAKQYSLPIVSIDSPSRNFSPSPSTTPTPTGTQTPTPTPTGTASNTPPPSSTPTPSTTPSATPTISTTPTPSTTVSASPTVSFSPTPSITPSPSPSTIPSSQFVTFPNTQGAAGFGDGTCYAIAAWNGRIVFGGTFSVLGDGVTSANRLALWDGSAWSTLPSGSSNGVSGRGRAVNALAVYNSKLYVGGTFTLLGDGTTSAKYIAAWDGSAWSNLTHGSSNGVSGAVSALHVFNSKLYVGGVFTALGNGVAALHIAAWDGSAWTTLPCGSSDGVSGGNVLAMATFHSQLFIGGSFTTLGNTTRVNFIASWDGNEWSDLPLFAANAVRYVGVGDTVNALAAFNSKLYIGGQFSAYGNGASPHLASSIVAWDGNEWSTLPIGSSNGIGGGFVNALAVVDSKLYVGGIFSTFGGSTGSAKSIAAWDGTTWSNLTRGSFNGVGEVSPTSVGPVYALAANGTSLILGGSFTTLGDHSTAANRIVGWDTTSSTFSHFSASSAVLPAVGLGASTRALALFDGKLYVGGDFISTRDGSISLKGVAAWDGSSWSPLPSGSSNGVVGSVNAMTVFQSKLFVGGTFRELGSGAAAHRIAAWDGTVWSTLPIGSSDGVSAEVFALAVFDSKLYVGGSFTTLGDGTSASLIAAWDGSAWSNLTIGSQNGVGGNNYVLALAVYNSKLFVSGSFTTLGDETTSAKSIAAWDGNVWSNLTIGSSNGVDGMVWALSAFDSKLYVGGTFTALGDGTSVSRIAAWDGTTWSTIPSGSSNGVGAAGVTSLATINSKLFVGGSFTTLGDGTTSANSIATWNGSAWSTLPGGDSKGVMGGQVTAFAGNGTSIYIAGLFNRLGDGTTAGSFVKVVFREGL